MASLFDSDIRAQAESLASSIAALPLAERVAALNLVRTILHEQASPFRGEPVDLVLWRLAEAVVANDYNPNHVAPPELRLLERSILADGYTQPIVAMDAGDAVEVVDGYHRSRVGKEKRVVRERVHGYLPLTLIKTDRRDRRDRIAATIRHNRARGVHGVAPMADIVAELIRQGWVDAEIAAELGMDADEVLRFKQTKALPELFKDHAYSKAWE